MTNFFNFFFQLMVPMVHKVFEGDNVSRKTKNNIKQLEKAMFVLQDTLRCYGYYSSEHHNQGYLGSASGFYVSQRTLTIANQPNFNRNQQQMCHENCFLGAKLGQQLHESIWASGARGLAQPTDIYIFRSSFMINKNYEYTCDYPMILNIRH